MNPILDQLAVAILVVAALGFFLRRAFGRKGKGACGGGCCCQGKSSNPLQKDQHFQ